MQIISVINYKGGVGKTTLTANLGAELAMRGKKILLGNFVKRRADEMKNVQSTLGVLLADMAKTVSGLSDEQIEKLLNGELRPKVSFEEIRTAKKDGLFDASADFDRCIAQLESAATREEGMGLLETTFFDKMHLVAFARFLDLPVQKKDKTDRVREKIVEATVGARLRSEAIRGGY